MIPSPDPKAQKALRFDAENKRDPRMQFAALPYRVRETRKGKQKLEILLITSRHSKRWILPKGWPMNGKKPAASAAQEAWEEAGVRGKVLEICLGLYSYRKWITKRYALPVIVAVYPVQVTGLADDFPEAGRRKRKWVTPKKAAEMVAEADLKRLLRAFTLDQLR